MAPPVLEAARLGKDYRDGAKVLTVLDGLDLAVAAGETVAVVGRSGCGKTTLLQCLGLLDRPTRGQVLLEGADASGWSRRRRDAWRASRVAFVFQHYPLLEDFTAQENVALALVLAGGGRPGAGARAADWLERVGLAEKARHLPARLSGGERQRCAIARALAGRPRALLADEPTGSLDARTGAGILALFHGLASQEGAAVLLVTHEPEWARGAARTLRLEGGRLVDGWQLAVDG